MRQSLSKHLIRRVVVAAAAAVVAAPLFAASGGVVTGAVREHAESPIVSSAVAPVAIVKVRLRLAVKNLPVALETPLGYDRSKFRHWIDANGDCQDTRDEVLKGESRIATYGCDIRRGKWYSYYDGRTWTNPSDVDIDHLVPLKEAWDSGAKRWNSETRQRYANDLADGRTLVAVTDNVNQSKSDRDPAEWLPRYGKCRYVAEWTATKIRWSLKANWPEKNRLVALASGCPDVILTIGKAGIGLAGTSGGTTGGTTDPRYSTCTEAKSRGYGPYYRSRDAEYYWYDDRDNDGIVCE
ncbi:MAG TPA: excalibur calcium-binding domain-containing protein [Marmoricola sp.]|nr:excalibur calcium-binding domain-containing protein [Marmoricola sp.]